MNPTCEYVWYPSKELIEQSNVKRFMDKNGISTYADLVKKSTEDIEWFWKAAVEELEVEWFKPYERVLDLTQGIKWAKWFTGGKLNVAYNALDRHVEKGRRNKLAFTWIGENGSVKKYTYRDLFVESNKLANFLRSVGVGKGDVVAIYLPMLPETVITLFAVLKVGAIFLPIFSGFAPSAIALRLKDAEPKVIVTADGSYRKGKEIPLKPAVDEAIELSSFEVEKVVVVERFGKGIAFEEEGDTVYEKAIKGQPKEFDCMPMDSEDPALLLYSSGTTGKPKGCVISHIGALVQPSKDIYFHFDLKDDEMLMWITDIGWMMGPWQIVGSQHLGASHLIFEGAIDYPKPDRIWSIIEEHCITHFGFAATVARMLKRYGDEWVKKHDLSSLRVFGNTGEPIDPESWMWFMKTVGEERCPMINISGGTELFGPNLSPSPVVPLKPSTLWGPGLGMDMDVFDEDGNPVRNQVGYLVCKKPAPSMTRGFWKDPQRYEETYWTKFPGVWNHADWALIDEDGFWFLFGRADDVIKVAGKRIGPAEIESIVNSHPAVAESSCVGIQHEIKGEEIACFVLLKPTYEQSEKLKEELREAVGKELGRPFEPSKIIFVDDLPRTRSGKIMRRIIRDIIHGRVLGDMSILENPDSIREIKKRVRLTFNR